MKPCPQCGSNGMPAILPKSQATARACQNCGYIQELRTANASQTAPKLTPEAKHGA